MKPTEAEKISIELGEVLSGLSDARGRVDIGTDTVEQDLARLVLALMEFLRQVMELQAIRRIENGTLSAEQEEALGMALMRSEGAIADMATRFGLSMDDLVLDLGPLGRTV